jgi:hypothetical protein
MKAERLAVAYEPKFDQKTGLKPSYISKQIDTFIGERLNVCLSKFKFEFKDKTLYGEDMEEPFVKVIKRGIDYQEKERGINRTDREREEAELEGFLKIQEVMSDPAAPVGTMMLSVSPKGSEGSLYGHNFYDIFTLKEEQNEKFVETRRYSSALSIEEYKDKLKPLQFMENISNGADFLKNPIKIENVFFKNADQVHAYLHRNHNTLDQEKFERIILSLNSLKQAYIQNRSPEILDAIMNKADAEAGIVKFESDRLYTSLSSFGKPLTVDQEIYFFGKQEVRKVATGCGSSGSSSKNIIDKISNNLFSVSESGLLGESEWFTCPKCSYKADGPVGNQCPGCGLTKEEYAQESGVTCD